MGNTQTFTVYVGRIWKGLH